MDENKKAETQDKFSSLASKLSDINKSPETVEASPLESVFNIAPGSTPEFTDSVVPLNPMATTLTDPSTGEIVTRDVEPDEAALAKEERIEELQIDGKLNEIYDNAMAAFSHHANTAETGDPRFSARTGEVAAQYLKIALDSANSKVDARYKRNKVRIGKMSAGTPNSVQQNLIVADRNELLKNIFSGDYERTIQQELKSD